MPETDPAEINLRWARALVRTLAAAGVRHAVASPGSRSTPLMLACEQTPEIDLHLQVDERSAAFLALGLARGSGAPAVLLATSGSAPAHWYPAVIEAAAAGVPLILLTADRPPELQDCMANQTIDQTRLFGVHVRAFHGLPVPDPAMLPHLPALAVRAVDQAQACPAGPVHLNLPFREPLVPAATVIDDAASAPPVTHRPAAPSVPTAGLADRLAGGRGVILCGIRPLEPGPVADLAARLRVPVLADPLSGLRFGPHDRGPVLTRYDAFLRSDGLARRLRPDWVLGLGGPPVSKVALRWLESCGARDVILADPDGRWPDPARRATEVVHADPAALCRSLIDDAPPPAPAGWAEVWRAAEAAAAGAVSAHRPPEAEVVAALAGSLPPETVLFAGNSLPVRELDWFSGAGPHALTILGNRGTSGIDGGISTTLGLAAGSGRPTVGLLGDLTFGHDLNGLAAGRDVAATLVVLNNGGGGIFEYLPQAQLPHFADHWLTPQALDIGAAVRAFGLDHREVDPGGLADALTAAMPAASLQVLEVTIDRNDSVARHRAYWQAVAAAVDTLGD